MRAPAPDAPRIAVCTVTHDSADELDGWWGALCRLHELDGEPDFRVIVVDCASSDDSPRRVRDLVAQRPGADLELIASARNLGFAGGMNRAIAQTTETDRWVLALNPDARPAPGALQAMVDAFTRYQPAEGPQPNWRVGSVTARLVRPSRALLDACGMRWTRSWRHLDRGSGEPDDGRFAAAEEVFAGTGAGTMYRRDSLLDVAFPAQGAQENSGDETEVFARDFHSFREDAELGLRLQRRGWRCVYEPAATFEHRRTNTPERRRSMTAEINRHSLRNRYLLRLWHQSAGNALRTPSALLRDLGILGFVLLRERESLPAYGWLWRNRRRILERRRELVRRQTAPSSAVDRWFAQHAFPLQRASPNEPST